VKPKNKTDCRVITKRMLKVKRSLTCP